MTKSRAQRCKEWRERYPEKVKAYTKKYIQENPDKIKENNQKRKQRGYYGGMTQAYADSPVGWARYKTNSIRRSAKQRGYFFDLDYTDILDLMVDKCPVFDIPINYSLGRSKGRLSINSPSLDRIDNTKGYTRDNILIVSQLANQVKHSLTLEEIQTLLPKMVAFYRSYYEQR